MLHCGSLLLLSHSNRCSLAGFLGRPLQAASLFDCTASVVTICSKAGGTFYAAYGLSADSANDLLGPELPHAMPRDIAPGMGCCSWVMVQLHKRMLVIEDCSTDLRCAILMPTSTSQPDSLHTAACCPFSAHFLLIDRLQAVPACSAGVPHSLDRVVM